MEPDHQDTLGIKCTDYAYIYCDLCNLFIHRGLSDLKLKGIPLAK